MSPEVVLMSLSIMRPGEVAVSDKAMSLISWLFGFLRLMGDLPRPPLRRSKAVMLAKVPLAVLSFALVSVFFGGRYKA